MQISQCPVLRPTWKEFQDFEKYTEKIDKLYKDHFGMVKVIPPQGWQPHCQDYQQRLKDLMVNGPIQQNIMGKGGVYECLHIQKKSISLQQYRQKTGVFDRITQGLSANEVETMFWKNIVFSPPLYGADLLNTLMDENCGAWNLNALKSPLRSAIDLDIRGVTTSYCYIGSWKTLFCWHKEDLELGAINYLHQGKSKFWYSIPASQSHILQRQARNFFPEHFSRCQAHLNHKTTLINPYHLQKKYPQLKISKTQHCPGQFMLVLGGAYHCGFNFGLNIAEAINYATVSWLQQLPSSRSCQCLNSSVKADKVQIMKNLQKSIYASTRQFKRFKEIIHEGLEKDQQRLQKKNQKKHVKLERENEKKTVKNELSRKIRKQGKAPRKIQIKGESYSIDNWAQCDDCSAWRKIDRPLPSSASFICGKAGKTCGRRQSDHQEYITL